MAVFHASTLLSRTIRAASSAFPAVASISLAMFSRYELSSCGVISSISVIGILVTCLSHSGTGRGGPVTSRQGCAARFRAILRATCACQSARGWPSAKPRRYSPRPFFLSTLCGSPVGGSASCLLVSWWAIAREPKRRITQEGTEKLHRNYLRWSVVEHKGVEPLASTMPLWRATNCANAPCPYDENYYSTDRGACKGGILLRNGETVRGRHASARVPPKGAGVRHLCQKQLPPVMRYTARDAAAAAKGARGACDACRYTCVARPRRQQVEAGHCPVAAKGRRQNRRQRVAVGPADRQQLEPGIARQSNFGGVWGSAKRSGASPSGGESAMPTNNPQKILRIRRPWPLQFMAANGRR